MKNFIHSIVFLVTVLSSVTGAVEEEVVYAQVGQTVVLKPIQANGADQQYMYWHRNGNDLAYRNAVVGWVVNETLRNRVSVTDSMLTISKLSGDDFGTLTLSVLNLRTGDKPTIYICHLFRIRVNMVSLSPVLASESLTLDCNTDNLPGFSKPEIYWLNPQGTKMLLNRPVHKATSQDNGEWTCIVKSTKESKATFSVAVVDLHSSPHRFTSKSSPLTIPCSLPSHVTWDQLKKRGIEEVQWQFAPNPPSGDRSNGQKQKLFSLSLDRLQWEPEHSLTLAPVIDVNKGNLSLTKRRGKEEDGGDYECIVKFKGGVTLTRTVRVDVLRIFASPGTNLISGQQLNLTCSTGSALPTDVQLKLFPPDKSPHSDHRPPNVTIPAVSTEHSGKWKCELWQGGKRVTSEVITLKIDYKLSVWMLVIICSAVVIVLLLLVVVFILYRRKQQRTGHPRHQLCRCKHPKPKGFYKT